MTDTVKLYAGNTEMVIGVSMGPRILSLRRNGGENLLYEDHTGFKVGEWKMYGGHRFTVAPETAASYYPDNSACEVSATGTGLLIRAPQRHDGIRLSMEITASPAEGFNIRHILENNGSSAWHGALWAITCVPRTANLLARCSFSKVDYWPGTAPENWKLAADLMVPLPGQHRGKTGWHEDAGWLAAIQPSGTLIICNNDHGTEKVNNNLEIFVCKDYAELETLGPQQTIAPGCSAGHLQQWHIFK
ncbi:hypothetical protein [Chitinophaga sp. YIM B06452]|uniref:hypothetical protein n=1 Tax=Chitinophaga sp. YIM B06452 TaxID=3082158 RepID=UPI0031FE8DB8